jgi:hypothetical protein
MTGVVTDGSSKLSQCLHRLLCFSTVLCDVEAEEVQLDFLVLVKGRKDR